MSAPLLLDASVWLAAIDGADRYHRASRRLVEGRPDAETTLAALDLTLYEVANVASSRWRSPSDARRIVRLVRLSCPDTLERVDEELLEEALRSATRHSLTVYDAAYVAAARRRGWTLVSCDLRDLVQPGLAVAPDAVVPTA